MMIFKFSLEEKGLVAGEGGKRAFDRIGKALHQALMEYWHANMLKRHFEAGAAQKYGYQPRSEEYTQRKARFWHVPVKKAKQYDLAFRGDMRRDLKANKMVKAYPTRFSLTMEAPDYVSMRPMNTRMPNLGEEVTRITEDEMRELEELAERLLPELVAQEGNKVTYRETIT